MDAPSFHGIDVGRVEAAIRAAEQRTSAELRVAISRFYFWGNVRRAAEATFAHVHMDRTRHRNGVLVFVAPRLRRFAIVADVGLQDRVPAGFWDGVARALGDAFRHGDRTGGLERALAAIGAALAPHFPREPDDRDELPNRVVV
jgi:uncharacterized membrane protein